VQCLSFTITASEIYLRGITGYHTHLNSTAREILDICKLIIDDSDFYRGFVFENEFLPSLFAVATTFPVNIALKKEAIGMLSYASPRQEAGWDSEVITKIAEDMLEPEE
jgi:hypothetical protein